MLLSELCISCCCWKCSLVYSLFQSKALLTQSTTMFLFRDVAERNDLSYNALITRNMAQGVLIDDDNCLVNTNPATGEVISKVKCTTPEELGDIIDNAKAAQKEWRKKTVEERIGILKDCVKELATLSEELTELIVKEMGKPIGEAKEEVQCAVEDQDEYFATMLESIRPKKYGKSTVVRHPYGVVAIMR